MSKLTLWLLGVLFPEQERNSLGPDTHLKAEHKHVCFLSDLNIRVVFKFAIHAHCFLGPAKERYSFMIYIYETWRKSQITKPTKLIFQTRNRPV